MTPNERAETWEQLEFQAYKLLRAVEKQNMIKAKGLANRITGALSVLYMDENKKLITPKTENVVVSQLKNL